MAKFKFYVDKKQTIWQREHHEIEANSVEELKAKLEEITSRCGNDPDAFEDELNSFDEQEMLFDTIEELPVEENDGFATIEVYLDESPMPEFIAANGIH